MTCAEVQRLLPDLADHGLSIDEEIAVGLHLQDCWLCSEELALIVEDLNAIRQEMQEPKVLPDVLDLQQKTAMARTLYRDRPVRRLSEPMAAAVEQLAVAVAILILVIAPATAGVSREYSAAIPQHTELAIRAGTPMEAYLKEIDLWLARDESTMAMRRSDGAV